MNLLPLFLYGCRSSYSQMNLSGLPPRVRRKRRSLLGGYPATSFRRSGGYFSEALERALHGFKQYLTRYHVSSFTGQRLSETTVHYRVAAIRRLLIASGRNDLAGDLVDDLRRVCGEDRNALNAVADFHSFLLHHYQPLGAAGEGSAMGMDFKPAAIGATADNGRGETSPPLPPLPSSSQHMDESAEGGGQSDKTPPHNETTAGSFSASMATPSVSSLFPSLPPGTQVEEGEDSATSMMPSASSSSPAVEGGGGGGQGQTVQRMRMPPSGKELVRWMSHDSGGKVSTSTAYSYGRCVSHYLLPLSQLEKQMGAGTLVRGAKRRDGAWSVASAPYPLINLPLCM
jgi:hypothetical protein